MAFSWLILNQLTRSEDTYGAKDKVTPHPLL